MRAARVVAGLMAMCVARTLAAPVEVVATVGQRVMIPNGPPAWLRHVSSAPVINDAGAVAFAASLQYHALGTPKPSTEDDDDKDVMPREEAVIVWERGRGMRVVIRQGDPVPGATNLVVDEVRPPKIGPDGSVLFDTEVKPPGRGGRSHLALWQWRAGKLHLLMREGEKLPGQAGLPAVGKWRAVVGGGGRVVAVVRPQEAAAVLVMFEDGKVKSVTAGEGRGKRSPGSRFEDILHACGDHIVFVRSVVGNFSNPVVCRVEKAGEVTEVLKGSDDPPANLARGGGPQRQVIGPIDEVRVTANGRVLVYSPGISADKFRSRMAVMVSGPDFDASGMRGVAAHGDDYKNLSYHADYLAVSGDGHVLFGDIGKETGTVFYLADPAGKVTRVMAFKDVPGFAARATVWGTAVADGGHAILELADDRGHIVAFAYDAKRGLRRMFEGGRGLPGTDGEVRRFPREEEPRGFVTSTGRWVFAWQQGQSIVSGGVAVVDITR